ncbi:fyn-binding protein [Plakobranchus ocellatus]|uniref:Fyn-binding protein n=1 Tax=Plakobranchus ocellatus TaxID=259542 RepID=A0AAV3YXT6_9GAST|nr:fyn-binding protein [Plakobranchus ocellatus]
MAVSGVKARLMLFEASENSNTAVDQKDVVSPSKPEPPVLQRFRQNSLQAQDSKDGEDGRPPVLQKPGKVMLNLKQNGGPAVASKTALESATGSSNSGVTSVGGTGKLNIASKFQQGAAPPPLKPVVPLKKPNTLPLNSETSNKSSSTEADMPRPKVALKPPAKTRTPTSPPNVNNEQKSISSPNSSAVNKPASITSPKSASFLTNGGPVNSFSESGPIKLPSLEGRPVLKKTESFKSSTSSTSSSTNPFKVASSSFASSDTSGPNDFRSQLKKTRPSLGDTSQAVAHNNQDNEPGCKSPADCTKDLSPTKSPETDALKRPSTSETTCAESIVERPSDNKRFKKVDLTNLPPVSSEAPEKPSVPDRGVDLTQICRQHAKMLLNINEEEATQAVDDEAEEDNVYDDGSSTVVVRRLPERPPANRESNRVSIIPEMSAEEEGFDAVYDDGQTPVSPEEDLVYDDAASRSQPSDIIEEEESIYEEESDVLEKLESEEDKKKRLKEEAEAKKREEKRRKEEEKKQREEEKKQRKEKQKEQERKKRFNLTGEEKAVGEGTIKEDAKGRHLLTVKKGQIVTIVRLDNNPVNKWLAKTDTDMGYVDSNNIEIDPDIIRQIKEAIEQQDMTAMFAGTVSSNSKPGDVQEDEIYDDVAAESQPQKEPEEDFEEIYEFVQ